MLRSREGIYDVMARGLAARPSPWTLSPAVVKSKRTPFPTVSASKFSRPLDDSLLDAASVQPVVTVGSFTRGITPVSTPGG